MTHLKVKRLYAIHSLRAQHQEAGVALGAHATNPPSNPHHVSNCWAFARTEIFHIDVVVRRRFSLGCDEAVVAKLELVVRLGSKEVGGAAAATAALSRYGGAIQSALRHIMV